MLPRNPYSNQSANLPLIQVSLDCHSVKAAEKRSGKKHCRQWINFINIVNTHFALIFGPKNYKAVFWVWDFLAPKYWQKVGIKCWSTDWALIEEDWQANFNPHKGGIFNECLGMLEVVCQLFQMNLERKHLLDSI